MVNLESYKTQLDAIERVFCGMLRQLPDKTEIANLLIDVSQTGLTRSLEFELFRPEEEMIGDFYAEIPINLRVVGSCDGFGVFVSGLAALPRIVTIHDMQIVAFKDVTVPLEMEAVWKRWLEHIAIWTNSNSKLLVMTTKNKNGKMIGFERDRRSTGRALYCGLLPLATGLFLPLKT